jgi:hypothetical protein
MCEEQLDLTHAVTCGKNGLCKACELRQEKLSSCYKNGAASDPYIDDPRQIHQIGSKLYCISAVLIQGRTVLDWNKPRGNPPREIKLAPLRLRTEPSSVKIRTDEQDERKL